MSIPKPDTCRGCSLFGTGYGFVPADGTGRNGVLIVLEAAGADEEEAGIPVVGKAGYYLFTQLSKVGLERGDFRIHNVLSCRPPDNKLAGAPYEAAAITHCSPNLDRTIADHKVYCERVGKHPVILALGMIAFKRVMGIERGDVLLGEDFYGYVHWSEPHQTWVVAAPHPSFLMRGQHQYVPVLQFAAQRAVEVGAEGFTFDEPSLLLDPTPDQFAAWVEEYFRALEADPTNTFLSTDIETPKKAKKGEDKLVREDDEDYIILRCSFAYRAGEAVSVPWAAEYLPILERLFACQLNQYIFWNASYDKPRIANQLPMAGSEIDAMLAWHVLNSALDKTLGFVTPYYWKGAKMWKHLSQREPAYYNALDALAALINFLGVKQDLIAQKQWVTFERHVVELNKVLNAMSATGLRRDEKMRQAAEEQLTALLGDTERKILEAVPPDARRLKVYKGKPREMEGVQERIVQRSLPVCDECGAVKPKKDHTKTFKKKVNPCAGAAVVSKLAGVAEWYKELPWKPSTVQLIQYQAALKQSVIRNRDGKATFDENAISALQRKYPKDPLYPLLLDHRKVQKLRGVYVGITDPVSGLIRGGLRIGRDGLIHCEYNHNPNTLRLACNNPNLQNLPRSRNAEDLETIVRNLIVAHPEHIFIECDFAGIEGVLTAYFARWRDGIRLAKLGVHAYLASHVLGRPADLGWSDADLRAFFKEIKGSADQKVKDIYNACKRCIHGSNYGMTPKKMVMAEPETFPTVAYAARIQDVYFEVAAPIRKWHLQTQMEAHQQGYLRNPFGYILRFSAVFRNVKEDGQWVRKQGEEANAALAFLPQSTAAGVIKEAMLRLYFDRYEEVGQYLRIQVHDSLLSEALARLADPVQAAMVEEMSRPVVELPLPGSYEMGSHLVIDVDSKRGERWGSMK